MSIAWNSELVRWDRLWFSPTGKNRLVVAIFFVLEFRRRGCSSAQGQFIVLHT